MARDLDGVDDKIRLNDTDFDFERTDSWSIYGWYFADDIGGGVAKILWGKNTNTGDSRGFDARISDADNRIVAEVNNDANAANRIKKGFNNAIDSSIWQHITVTYDGSSTAAGVKLYKNATEITDVIVNEDSLSATILNNFNFEIGNGDGFNAPFNGKIANFGVNTFEFGLGQVKHVFRFGYWPNRLKAYYPLYGVASPEVDLSGNRINGTVTGAVSAPHSPTGRYVFAPPYQIHPSTLVIISAFFQHSGPLRLLRKNRR